jgi:ketosteroid isomerase-like protein
VEEARGDAGLSNDPNVEVILRVNEKVERGEPEAIAEHLHADVVWEHNIGVGSPEEGVYRGRESVLRLFERIVEPWDYLRAEPRAIEPLGDGRYHVVGALHAKHRTSDVEVSASYEQHLEVLDEKLVKGTMTTGELRT